MRRRPSVPPRAASRFPDTTLFPALDRGGGEVMTAPAVTVASHDRALAALSLMTRRRIRHLPVIDGGHLIGLVSIGDLVKYRIDRSEEHTSELQSLMRISYAVFCLKKKQKSLQTHKNSECYNRTKI